MEFTYKMELLKIQRSTLSEEKQWNFLVHLLLQEMNFMIHSWMRIINRMSKFMETVRLKITEFIQRLTQLKTGLYMSEVILLYKIIPLEVQPVSTVLLVSQLDTIIILQ